MRILVLAFCVACAASPVSAQRSPNPQIDYAGFIQLSRAVQPYRAQRLVEWDTFTKMKSEGALIIDARSADAFAQGHIGGAVSLPLTDFTAARLKEVIGADHGRPILIYCNNNFSNDKAPVLLKVAVVSLNIQTFINLYAYGYPNIYELNDIVDFTDPKIGWVGTLDALAIEVSDPTLRAQFEAASRQANRE